MNVFDSVVITGAGGMLGRALTKLFASRGIATHACDRTSCDISNRDAIARLFQEARPTILFNCAAHTKVDACEDEQDKADLINGLAVGWIAERCREYGTKLVHVSTDFVFDGKANRPYRVDDPTNPISAYGASKLLGEQEIARVNPPGWLIARTAWVYGEGGANFVKIIVDRARSGGALNVVNDEVGAPTCTKDLAEALVELVEKDAHGLFHVTNAGSVSRYEYAKAILAAFGIHHDIGEITTAEWLKIRPKQARRPAYSVLDLTATEQALGRKMRPWQDALAEFARHGGA